MESQPQVTPADQEMINEFSTKITHKDRITEELKKLEFEKEQIDDVSLELEMMDDEDKINYIINSNDINSLYESFVKLRPQEIIRNLELKNEVLENRIESLTSDLETVDENVKALKTKLYAKFGDNINLER